MKRLELGYKGYYGAYLDPRNNVISGEMNKLVDEYNHKINSFDTYEEQLSYIEEFNIKINKLKEKIII